MSESTNLSLAYYAGYEDGMARTLPDSSRVMGLCKGECEWVLEHSGTLYDKWHCSKCGFLFVEPRCDQGYTDLEPKYCPRCGRKVVDA